MMQECGERTGRGIVGHEQGHDLHGPGHGDLLVTLGSGVRGVLEDHHRSGDRERSVWRVGRLLQDQPVVQRLWPCDATVGESLQTHECGFEGFRRVVDVHHQTALGCQVVEVVRKRFGRQHIIFDQRTALRLCRPGIHLRQDDEVIGLGGVTDHLPPVPTDQPDCRQMIHIPCWRD